MISRDNCAPIAARPIRVRIAKPRRAIRARAFISISFSCIRSNPFVICPCACMCQRTGRTPPTSRVITSVSSPPMRPRSRSESRSRESPASSARDRPRRRVRSAIRAVKPDAPSSSHSPRVTRRTLFLSPASTASIHSHTNASHDARTARTSRATTRTDARAVCICCSRAPPPRSPRTTLATRAIGFSARPCPRARTTPVRSRMKRARCPARGDVAHRRSRRARRRARWARRCVRFRFSRPGLSRSRVDFVRIK